MTDLIAAQIDAVIRRAPIPDRAGEQIVKMLTETHVLVPKDGDQLTDAQRGYVDGLVRLIEVKEASKVNKDLFSLNCQVLTGYMLAGEAAFGDNRTATLRRWANERAGVPGVRIARDAPAG